jgi:transcription-repair coupling factor (superfamily II helicase)
LGNLETLLVQFQQDARLAQLLDALAESANTGPARLQLQGLRGSLAGFVVATAYQQAGRHHLVVAGDKEEAAYLQNTIANLLDPKPVRFFPDSFKRPLYFEVLESNNALQRTETVNLLTQSKSKGEIVVTYPEALFEKVVAPEVLNANRIHITVGENVDVDTMIEILTDYGFQREDFVYEPGQFSIRGGIIDIFSYGNDYPYRVELFDEEVETIRTFNPMDQLSVQNIKEVSIVPNINTKFSQDQKVSLFQVLPEDTLIWMRDWQLMLDKLVQCFERAEEFAQTITILDESERAQIFRDRAFIRPGEVAADVADHPLIFFTDHAQPLPVQQKISYAAQPQPSFNKNFSLLIEHLQENTKAGITNYILTDNPKQIERFYSIFEDLEAQVDFHPVLKAVHEGFTDQDLGVAVFTDHQIFERFHRYRLKRGFTKDQALNLKMLRELEPGDFVVHIDHGIGRFSGLEKLEVNGKEQESVRIVYKNNDLLYVGINSLHKLSKYSGKDGAEPALHKLGSDTWKTTKNKAKKKVKDIAGKLIKLYAKRKATPGFAFPKDGYLQNELEASFMYEDTPDQFKATVEMKEDMMAESPMDRLICGDVGFGKTEIAVRGAFKAVVGGRQVAVLVPTTILALQHYRTFKERLAEFGVEVDYVNRFRTTGERNKIFKRVEAGEVDIIIGTHALLNKKVKFKNLGLLIIDEEQKFGVAAKEKLRNLAVNVDTLTLTATPIPRTLQFSLLGARDLSIIRTPPPNRQPIHTEVRIFKEELIKDAIYYEVQRGGQVFFVHNRVKSLPDITALIRRLCPDVDIASAHGQMEPKELERTLIDFIDRRHEVLVCTNIIETGLDIPNANTMIINQAQQFGLSDLHQLRGRVGRSNKRAFCYLLAPPLSALTPDARKRLRTLEEFSELGSGFNIAMRDLDIRGAGNLLGGEQSGFITDIGYETYQRVLDEAIRELKEKEFREMFQEDLEKQNDFVRDVQVDTDVEMLIPDDYITNIQERLNLYTELDSIETEEGLAHFAQGLRDRFGPTPPQVEELYDGLRLRWECKKLGFERVVLKSNKLRLFFVEDPQSLYYETKRFQTIMQFVQTEGTLRGLRLKQTPRSLILIKEDVASLSAAQDLLLLILEKIEKLEGVAA